MAMIMQRLGMGGHFRELLADPKKKFAEVQNYVLARKPRFAIIGTGRSGTTFSSAHLTNAGVPVSHERYYTYDGPRLRHPYRNWHAVGDSSWCAVPFLPDPDVVAIHQVRHPYEVIKSFYNIGFFDERYFHTRQPYVNLAKRFFTFSDDPLQSCLRWYIEWNERCEKITPHRFQIERLADHTRDIERWLGLDVDLSIPKTDTTTNTRQPLVDKPINELKGRLQAFPEFADLERMAERYGYDL